MCALVCNYYWLRLPVSVMYGTCNSVVDVHKTSPLFIINASMEWLDFFYKEQFYYGVEELDISLMILHTFLCTCMCMKIQKPYLLQILEVTTPSALSDTPVPIKPKAEPKRCLYII